MWINTYYASWQQGWHDSQGYMTSDKVDYSAMTHITHFYVGVNGDGTLNNIADSYGMDSTNTTAVVAKARARGVKILFSVAANMNNAASDPTRGFFIHNLMNFMRQRGYDGIDIDWEPMNSGDTTNFRKLINQLYDSVQSVTPRPLLNAAAPPYAPWAYRSVWQKFDQINVMTYDLSGNWGHWVTWPNCPIYARDSAGNLYVFPWNGQPPPNIDGIIESFHNQGIPYSKLGFGTDWYYYDWSGGLVKGTYNGVTAPRQEWIVTPGCTGGSVGHEYYSLMDRLAKNQNARRLWDPGTQTPYISVDAPGSENDHFISYDDQQAIFAKITYARQKGIGGIIAWELGGAYRANLPVGARDSLLQMLKTAIVPLPPPSLRPTSRTPHRVRGE